jgi:WD40 repeat protein
MPISRNPFHLDRLVKSLRAAAIIGVCLGLFGSATSAAEPPVTAIAFTPDGQSVVVGSQAGLTVRHWPDLKEQRQLDTKIVNVHDLAFSPNGKSLAVAGGTPSEAGLVEVFTWPNGDSTSLFKGHEDSVLAVAWKNDSTFATASLDSEVAVWDAKTRKRVQRLKGHSRGVSDVCFLRTGNLLVSGSLDQNLRVWDTNSEELIRTLNNHTREIYQLALRPAVAGLPMIASVSGDRTVRLWQPTIGRMVRFAQLNSIPLAVVWLRDGSHVAVAATDGHVRLIDPDTVEILQDIPAVDGWAYSLGVHPTDGSLLVGGRNGQLKRIVIEAPKR